MPAADYCTTPTAAGRRKRRFRSAAAARRTARLMRGGALPQLVGVHYRPYRCESCDGWHLSSRPLRDDLPARSLTSARDLPRSH